MGLTGDRRQRNSGQISSLEGARKVLIILESYAMREGNFLPMNKGRESEAYFDSSDFVSAPRTPA